MFNFEHYVPCFDEKEFKDESLPIAPYPLPSALYKSTATIITSINQNINIDYLYHFFKADHCRISRIHIGKNNKEEAQMYNQISMVISVAVKKKNKAEITKRQITTKIFQNGTVHMTGCQTTNDSMRALKILIQGIKNLKIKIVLPASVNQTQYEKKTIYCVNNPNMHHDDFKYKYRMINRHFTTNFEFSAGDLYKILQKKQWRVNYNPNRFSGVVLNIQINKKSVTYLMFKSGKITVSLANCTDSIIHKAYKFINDILRDEYEQIVKHQYIL